MKKFYHSGLIQLLWNTHFSKLTYNRFSIDKVIFHPPFLSLNILFHYLKICHIMEVKRVQTLFPVDLKHGL